MLAHCNTHCIVDECFMLSSFYAYYNLYNIKYVFHRNTGFKPPSYNTSLIISYSIYMCLIFPLSIYMCPSNLPLSIYICVRLNFSLSIHMCSSELPPFGLVERCCSIFSFLCSVLLIIVCCFVNCRWLTMVFFVFLRFTDSDFPVVSSNFSN